MLGQWFLESRYLNLGATAYSADFFHRSAALPPTRPRPFPSSTTSRFQSIDSCRTRGDHPFRIAVPAASKQIGVSPPGGFHSLVPTHEPGFSPFLTPHRLSTNPGLKRHGHQESHQGKKRPTINTPRHDGALVASRHRPLRPPDPLLETTPRLRSQYSTTDPRRRRSYPPRKSSNARPRPRTPPPTRKRRGSPRTSRSPCRSYPPPRRPRSPRSPSTSCHPRTWTCSRCSGRWPTRGSRSPCPSPRTPPWKRPVRPRSRVPRCR